MSIAAAPDLEPAESKLDLGELGTSRLDAEPAWDSSERMAREGEMKSRYLPYEKTFDDETSIWCLVGRDVRGEDFGVGAGESMEMAEQRLRAWILDSLLASAGDGEDRSADLGEIGSPQALVFTPLDLVPIALRALRARHGLSQAQVAERLGMSQQAYAKLERPGANLQLRTIQQVERALDDELLQMAE